MSAPEKSHKIVVVGFGNTLRGDDGAGPWVAGLIAGKAYADVMTIVRQQLTPEMAEVLASAGTAIFVDARAGPGLAVTVAPLTAAPAEPFPTHVSDPRSLLALAQSLYGWAPPAWLVTVAGDEFGLSETLSATGQRNAREACLRIEALIAAVQVREVRN